MRVKMGKDDGLRICSIDHPEHLPSLKSLSTNLVQYFRGLELVSDKMDKLSDQVTGVEHGLSDIRGNMKILWRKSNEREDAQNILSKNLKLEKQHQRGIQT